MDADDRSVQLYTTRISKGRRAVREYLSVDVDDFLVPGGRRCRFADVWIQQN